MVIGLFLNHDSVYHDDYDFDWLSIARKDGMMASTGAFHPSLYLQVVQGVQLKFASLYINCCSLRRIIALL